MLDNNLLFSLLLAAINTTAFFLIKNSDETQVDKEKINQELLILFGIPTNPSSSASGIVFIILLFFV